MRLVQQEKIGNGNQGTAAPNAPPTTPAPVPTGPAPLERLLRTVVHGVGIIVATNALAALLQTRPLGQQLLTIISPIAFVPWSIGTSAGLNADRLAIVTLLIVVTINGWPNHLLGPLTASLAGIIAGLATRHVLLGGHDGR